MHNEKYLNCCENAKVTAILHMAFDFASMARTFEVGTKKRFLKKVHKLLQNLTDSYDQNMFNELHDIFCTWGCNNIKSSKKHGNASYGQIAKTLNVMLKVAIMYCDLPNTRVSQKLIPLLHPAIDNPMMKYLKKRHRNFPGTLLAIASVDKGKYLTLLDLAKLDIEENYEEPLCLVQWEDIVWTKMNAKSW